MQSLDVFDSVVFVGLGWFAAVHLLDGFKALLLQVGPVGEEADYPGERVTEVDTCRNFSESS